MFGDRPCGLIQINAAMVLTVVTTHCLQYIRCTSQKVVMMTITKKDMNLLPAGTGSSGLLAGLAGGAAEVMWITIYSDFTGTSATAVAKGVTATVLPAVAGTIMAVPFALAIHFVLAAMLGLAVAVLLRASVPHLAGGLTEFALVAAVLAAVWAVNFLLVLPLLNPAFPHLLPMPVSFISKIMFGLAAAAVLRTRQTVSHSNLPG